MTIIYGFLHFYTNKSVVINSSFVYFIYELNSKFPRDTA